MMSMLEGRQTGSAASSRPRAIFDLCDRNLSQGHEQTIDGPAFYPWKPKHDRHIPRISGRLPLRCGPLHPERRAGLVGALSLPILPEGGRGRVRHLVRGKEGKLVLSATLDEPGIAAPTAHVYIEHQQPWVKLGDGLPTHERF